MLIDRAHLADSRKNYNECHRLYCDYHESSMFFNHSPSLSLPPSSSPFIQAHLFPADVLTFFMLYIHFEWMNLHGSNGFRPLKKWLNCERIWNAHRIYRIKLRKVYWKSSIWNGAQPINTIMCAPETLQRKICVNEPQVQSLFVFLFIYFKTIKLST